MLYLQLLVNSKCILLYILYRKITKCLGYTVPRTVGVSIPTMCGGTNVSPTKIVSYTLSVVVSYQILIMAVDLIYILLQQQHAV